MTLRDFLLDALGRKTLAGWREVRPTWREVIGILLSLALVGYVAYLAFWSGIENHCLLDHLGSKCLNGGN